MQLNYILDLFLIWGDAHTIYPHMDHRFSPLSAFYFLGPVYTFAGHDYSNPINYVIVAGLHTSERCSLYYHSFSRLTAVEPCWGRPLHMLRKYSFILAASFSYLCVVCCVVVLWRKVFTHARVFLDDNVVHSNPVIRYPCQVRHSGLLGSNRCTVGQ